MRYARAVKVGILKKVLPPESLSIAEVSRETGINDQTIRNWIKQHKSGSFEDVSSESCPRFMTAKEKYQVLLDASALDDDERGGFLRERGIHSEHLVIWDQELRELMAKKADPKDQELRELKKKNKELEKELQRKEKALAEAAALLILKKNSTPLRRTTRSTDC
jgi:transposase-like protein